jgi:hypothetical protein
MKTLGLCMIAGLLSGEAPAARAANFTFTFDETDNGLTSFSETVGGITLTVTATSGTLIADGNGIKFSADSSIAQSDVYLTFDHDIYGGSYVVGATSPGASGNFGAPDPILMSTLYQYPATPAGIYDFADRPKVPAGIQVDFQSQFSGAHDWSALKSITVADVPFPVPEPINHAAVIASLCLAGAVGFRAARRFAKAGH